jgi:hypothetical protein
MKTHVYPLALWMLVAGAAQAQDPATLAQRLVERSGLGAQLRSVPKSFEEQMERSFGRIPDELRVVVTEAGREAFKPEPMAHEVANAVVRTLKPEAIQNALAWLDTEVGRRVTLAEVHSSDGDVASRRQYAEQAKKDPPATRRQQLIGEIAATTSQVELGMNLLKAIVLGVAIGTDSMQPVENRAGRLFVREHAENAFPKERLRAGLHAMMPGIVAYNYRDVSDADLAAYIAFLRSADGKRYNDAMTAAYAEAMAAASVRLGDFVEQRMAGQRK